MRTLQAHAQQRGVAVLEDPLGVWAPDVLRGGHEG